MRTVTSLLRSFILLTSKFWVSIPTKEKIKIKESCFGNSILNFPSISVTTPIVVPFNKIVTPGNVCPASSTTLPLTTSFSTPSFFLSSGVITIKLSTILKPYLVPVRQDFRTSCIDAFVKERVIFVTLLISSSLYKNSKDVFCFSTLRTSLNDCFSNCTVIVCCPNAFSLENAKCVNSNNTIISLQPNDSLLHLISQFLILLLIDNLFRSFLHTSSRTFRQIHVNLPSVQAIDVY